MTNSKIFSIFGTGSEEPTDFRSILHRLIKDQGVSSEQLAADLGVNVEQLDAILDGAGWDSVKAWAAFPNLAEVLRRHGVLPDGIEPPSVLTGSVDDMGAVQEQGRQDDYDPFDGSAEEIPAEETRQKVELSAWADDALRLKGVEFELALGEAVKRFSMNRTALGRIVKARKEDKNKEDQTHRRPKDDRSETDVRYYGDDFKVSNRGVFMKRPTDDGTFDWECISKTRIDLEALTRDRNGENWGTYASLTDRDGEIRKLAIAHALLGGDKATEISSIIFSLGVALVQSKPARQALLLFLTTDVTARITSVSQIGWYQSDGAWVFVRPEEALVPSGFAGARPVLQTASLQTQHGLDASGTVAEWIEQIARPLADNSNIHLCVGTAFAGPLLHWANEPPGFFHLWGTSKIAKSLAAAVGQSVWGKPKVPGEADAFGASWTATAVGLERYAVLRSDIGGSFDEIGEGAPKVIRAAIYVLANGSTKLRGTQDINLRPMESFRILGISTGEPTMTAFLSADGEKVPAGLTVRLVDVPAEVRPESAFETCPVDQIEELGRRFYPLTTRLHGAVGRDWLQHLVDLGPDGIQVRVREHREAWLARPEIAAVRATATGQVRSILNRFALVAAALRMGIEAGFLPWTLEDTDLGIAACMVRWAQTRKGRLDLAGEMVAAVEQIRQILAADLQGRFVHLQIDEEEGCLDYASSSDGLKRDTLGFVKDGLILVEPTAWRNVLCAGYDAEKTAQHLRNEGLLIADKGKLQKQERVIRGGTPAKGRFYCLDLRILEDAAGNGVEAASE